MTAPVMPVGPYAARLTIDYPERLDRVTTFFRLIWVIPIAIVLGVITGSGTHMMVTAAGEQIVGAGGGLLAGLAFATALMIVIRMRYPRWWFDFARELTASAPASVPTWPCSRTDIRPLSRSNRCTSRSSIQRSIGT